MGNRVESTGAASRVSLQDIAERAGVSLATVSRSLRGLSNVSAETRERVLAAARELSYVTTIQAPEFAPGPKRTVAIIVPFITRWFFTTVTAAAVDRLRASGYDVLLYHLGNADIRDDFFARMPLAGRVDGILVLSTPLHEEHTLALRALDIPLVVVGTILPGVPSVGIDSFEAARSAVNHLLALGHERIGLIVGQADDPRFEFASSGERREGCERALHDAGLVLPDELVASGPHGLAGGATAMAELLARPVLPTAVFAEYDELAIGATWALRRAGLAVPADLSVIGIDDHEMAQMVDLTTVAQEPARQGGLAATMLLQVLGAEAGQPPDDHVLVTTRLMLRGTTAPPTTTRRSTRARSRPRTDGSDPAPAAS